MVRHIRCICRAKPNLQPATDGNTSSRASCRSIHLRDHPPPPEKKHVPGAVCVFGTESLKKCLHRGKEMLGDRLETAGVGYRIAVYVNVQGAE